MQDLVLVDIRAGCGSSVWLNGRLGTSWKNNNTSWSSLNVNRVRRIRQLQSSSLSSQVFDAKFGHGLTEASCYHHHHYHRRRGRSCNRLWHVLCMQGKDLDTGGEERGITGSSKKKNLNCSSSNDGSYFYLEEGEKVLDDDDGDDGVEKVSASSAYQPYERRMYSSAAGTYSDIEYIVDNLKRIPEWADTITERGMHRRRTFYSQDDWLRHRSSTRHYRHFKSSFSSRAILSLIPPVGTFTGIAAVLALYNSSVTAGWFPSFIPLFHASPLPYTLTAPALALLLVFRTEASYSRYDEARKTWTKVISSSKDMARQAMAWIQRPADSRHKKLLVDYIMAFTVALKCHVLYGSDIAGELKDILDDEDLELVLSAKHRPNCLIQLMTELLKVVQLEDNERSLLVSEEHHISDCAFWNPPLKDANISQFNDGISICERLIRTPIPLSYTRLTSRFLVLWHLTLPVVLWDDCHWMVVPATFISAASLFCIEEVGVLIEEPFPILALDRMCAKVHENIQELSDLQVQAQDHLKMKTKKSKSVTNGVTSLREEASLGS